MGIILNITCPNCLFSAMPFKFESLNIWKKALDLSIKTEDFVKVFPRHELFNLSNQVRKAADSVVLNIGERCTRQSNAELKRFLNYSIRSAIDVDSCLFIARRKEYINEEMFHGIMMNTKPSLR